MAVDQALLEHVARGGPPVLRFYAWSPATLSLGYFQTWKDRTGHTASLECPTVRRTTGGGAILHDEEITYALVVPYHRGRDVAWRKGLMRAIHEAGRDALATQGIRLSLAGASCRSHAASANCRPFLCFQHITPGDGMVAGHKVLGSAQRAAAGALLQHGSLLLRRSPYAPELPGILDALSQTSPAWQATEICHLWGKYISSKLGTSIYGSHATTSEISSAQRLRDARFAQDDWTRRR